jgi:hypothetical protein
VTGGNDITISAPQAILPAVSEAAHAHSSLWSTKMTLALIATIEDAASGLKLEIWAQDNGLGGTYFEIKSVGENTSSYDLNGFFVDVNNDGGSIFSTGQKLNNMNGSAADGTKLDGFDFAKALGSVGGNDANWTEGSFTIDGLAYADLDGAQIGLRLTSVGADGEGSLKLVGDADIPHGNEDHFPELDKDISNIVLYFNTTEGDTRPDPDGDGFYTVKIDDVPESASDDLDDWLGDVLAHLVAEDPNVTADTGLQGVAIKYGTTTEFYAMDNDPAPDTPPNGTEFPLPGNQVDQSYQYDEVFV